MRNWAPLILDSNQKSFGSSLQLSRQTISHLNGFTNQEPQERFLSLWGRTCYTDQGSNHQCLIKRTKTTDRTHPDTSCDGYI